MAGTFILFAHLIREGGNRKWGEEQRWVGMESCWVGASERRVNEIPMRTD